MTYTLATRYTVTRDPNSDFPELAGVGNIIDEDHVDGEHYVVTVWGSGVRLEQNLNAASSVVSFAESGSVVADLDTIREAITDEQYSAWVANQTHDGSPRQSRTTMAQNFCEEFALGAIHSATGVVDITTDVVNEIISDL